MARPSLVTPALAACVTAAFAAITSIAAPTSPAATALVPRSTAPADVPQTALVPRSTVPADVPQAALDAQLKGDVVVRVHVSRLGTVDSASAIAGDARLRAPALAAARWYLYAPQPVPTWSTTTIMIDGSAETDPLPLDILGMAREADSTGHFRAALDIWAGALNRCGAHPTIRNPWAIREHIAEVQKRLPVMPEPDGDSNGKAMGARVEQQRTVSRAGHADLVIKFEDAQRNLPWWDELYQWNAASLLGCGRSQDAIRTLLIFRAATRDSASRQRADRALAGIAAGDTLMVGEMLKKEGRQFDRAE